jgi:hypothetical protein
MSRTEQYRYCSEEIREGGGGPSLTGRRQQRAVISEGVVATGLFTRNTIFMSHSVVRQLRFDPW